jgi:hypothetical protein
MHTPTRPSTDTHERPRTHRQIRNTYCFSTAKIICESASVLSHLYDFVYDFMFYIQTDRFIEIWSEMLHASELQLMHNIC